MPASRDPTFEVEVGVEEGDSTLMVEDEGSMVQRRGRLYGHQISLCIVLLTLRITAIPACGSRTKGINGDDGWSLGSIWKELFRRSDLLLVVPYLHNLISSDLSTVSFIRYDPCQ